MEIVSPNWLLFDRQTDNKRDRVVQSRVEENDKPEKEKPLLCVACRHGVTREEERISVNGAHRHHFSNPLGLEFEIGCFRRAPGCRSLGEHTIEHTWFAGFNWQVAVCSNCQNHLGWLFRSAESSFFSLILKELISQAGNG